MHRGIRNDATTMLKYVPPTHHHPKSIRALSAYHLMLGGRGSWCPRRRRESASFSLAMFAVQDYDQHKRRRMQCSGRLRLLSRLADPRLPCRPFLQIISSHCESDGPSYIRPGSHGPRWPFSGTRLPYRGLPNGNAAARQSRVGFCCAGGVKSKGSDLAGVCLHCLALLTYCTEGSRTCLLGVSYLFRLLHYGDRARRLG